MAHCKVARWLASFHSLETVHDQRGWDALVAIEYSIQKPRPSHPNAAGEEDREALKKLQDAAAEKQKHPAPGKAPCCVVVPMTRRPTEGRVELDGHLSDAGRWRTWRQHIGFVAQDDRLLSGTLAENISAFDPDLDMTRVEAAAEAAQVAENIARFPMRYLSLVGDMGSTLSGGQRQRVLLARALYRQPKILFLDEGGTNLDEATEERLADLIANLPITRIIVAHRPALVRRASKVFLVEDCQQKLLSQPAEGITGNISELRILETIG